MNINENNRHIYGISIDLGKLLHFDEKFVLIQNVQSKNIYTVMKVFNNKFFV